MAVSAASEALTVDGERFQPLWLRDHCRCQACFNHATHQRRLDVSDLPWAVHPKTHSVEAGRLQVVWNDGHESVYSIGWLKSLSFDNFLRRQTRQHVLWTVQDIASLPVAHVTYGDLLESTEGVRSLVKSLVDYGVGFVEEVPADVESTEKAVTRVSHVQHTLFGGMWQFSDTMVHSDTAYTTEALPAHNDNTYFTEAAGLQILHCLHHDGTGGENLLVDGFKALELLKAAHPEVFQRLTTTLVEGEYREEGIHHSCVQPMVKLNPLTKQVEQIRFNLNDRAALSSVGPEDILQHYQDLRTFTSYLRDPKLEWWFKLRPGTVLFFDNFRTLHGRSAYTGHRTMCGCYVGRGDFLSKARVLGVLTP